MRKTKRVELPSIIGISGPSQSIMQLSTPIPAKADIRCSIVAISAPSCSKVVERVVSPTKFACAGISTTLSPFLLLKIIPVSGSAGCNVRVAFFPVCRPTPVADVLFLIVLCASIVRYFSVLRLNLISQFVAYIMQAY